MPKPADIFNVWLRPDTFKSLNQGRRDWDATYPIYSISELGELLFLLRSKSSTACAVRYLVDTSFHLWFAKEGIASAKTPAHYQMTGEPASSARCIAAGNLYFSPDYREIIGMNHKSGDFRPHFDSIKWLLAILIAHDDMLSSSSIEVSAALNIEKLTSSGGHEATYTLEKEELRTWLSRTFGEAKIDSLKTIQPTGIKLVTYEAPSYLKRRGAFLAPPISPAGSPEAKDDTDSVVKRLTFV